MSDFYYIFLLWRHFEPAIRRAGFRQIRFHDLRHTFASLLIEQGEHPKYIQVQMGYSSISVTMDVRAFYEKRESGVDETSRFNDF